MTFLADISLLEVFSFGTSGESCGTMATNGQNASRTNSGGEGYPSLISSSIFLTKLTNGWLIVLKKHTVEADVRFLRLLSAVNCFYKCVTARKVGIKA